MPGAAGGRRQAGAFITYIIYIFYKRPGGRFGELVYPLILRQWGREKRKIQGRCPNK